MVAIVLGFADPQFPDQASLGQRVMDRFDVVIYDPRGTGVSDALDCPDGRVNYCNSSALVSAVLRSGRRLKDPVPPFRSLRGLAATPPSATRDFLKREPPLASQP